MSPEDLVQAECRKHDPELFVPDGIGRPSSAQINQAKTVCHQCPIRLTCLQDALKRGEPWGVWGGELFQAGYVVPEKARSAA